MADQLKNQNEKCAEVEAELQGLAEADAQGGATPAVTATIAISIALCPTGKCSSKC